MGMFAFRRAREKEAALLAASVPAAKPKRKRKPKVSTNGDNDSCDLGSSKRKQLHNAE